MKIYEFRSDISVYEDDSEPTMTVEIELFLTKQKAIDYMRAKAMEYQNKEGKNKFYISVEEQLKDDCIELNNKTDSNIYGIFEITERAIID